MKKNNPKNVLPRAVQQSEKERWYLEIVTRIYVIFILALYPLYVTAEGYDNIVFRKAQMYWAGTIIFLVAFAIFYLVYILGRSRTSEKKPFWKDLNYVDWALLAFLLALTLSFSFSPYKDVSWLGGVARNDGYLTMLLMILCYFPISRYYKPKQLDFTLYAIGSSVLCIIGFLQFYGYDLLQFPYNRYPYYADIDGNPYYSGYSIIYRTTIGNIDFLSCYVCVAIVVFGILFVKSSGWRQFQYLSAAVMNFALMIIGGADAGKVGTLGAMVLLVPYWILEKKNLGKVLLLSSSFGLVYCLHHWVMLYKIMPGWTTENRPLCDMELKSNYPVLPLKPILIASIVCLAIGICVLLIKKIAWPKTKTTHIAGVALLFVLAIGGVSGVEIIGKHLPPQNIIYQAREIMHGNIEDDFGSRRGFIWKRAMERVQYQPIFGTGSDTFYYAFGKLNQAEAKELHGVEYDKAHNDFIQILLCNGWPGLLTYLAFITGIIISSIKKSFDNMFALIALGGILAYLIQSFFGIDTLIVTPIYWTMLAILRSAKSNKDECLLT